MSNFVSLFIYFQSYSCWQLITEAEDWKVETECVNNIEKVISPGNHVIQL